MANVNGLLSPGSAVRWRPRGLGLRPWLLQFGAPSVVLLSFMGGWAVISVTAFGDRNYLLPRPWAVVAAAAENGPLLLGATWLTLVESFLGLALASGAGVAIAVMMSQSRVVERSLWPYLVLLQVVPIVAVAPLIVLWLGYQMIAVVVIAALIALFPIATNTLLGLVSVEQSHVDLFTLHRASGAVRFFKLQLPAAVPNIIAGLRISSGLSVVGAIVGEFIIGSGGSQGGLGVKLMFTQARLDTPLLFGEVIASTLLGLSLFLAISLVGHLVLHSWHESARSKDG